MTKVNSEIREIAQKPTRSMDAHLQKLQESLVKGLIPKARLTGTMDEILEDGKAVPAPFVATIQPVMSELFGDDFTN